MQIAIVGLAGAGKTTVFNTLTRGHAETGGYGALQLNVGVVKVPDPRLDKLAEVFKPKKIVQADITYVDLPAPPASSEGRVGTEELPAEHMARLREADALIHVVRAWDDAAHPHPAGSVDAARDIEQLDLEFMLADLAMIDRRLERLQAGGGRHGTPAEREANEREEVILVRLKAVLEGDRPIRDEPLDPDDEKAIRGFRFLTQKPVLILVNVGEGDLAGAPARVEAIGGGYGHQHALVDALSAKIEMELGELDPDEAAVFMEELGLSESSLDRVIALSYRLVGPDLVPDRGPRRGPGLADPRRLERRRRGGRDPHGPREGVHPRRDHRLRGAAGGGLDRRGEAPRQGAVGGQDLPRPRWGRHGDPVQPVGPEPAERASPTPADSNRAGATPSVEAVVAALQVGQDRDVVGLSTRGPRGRRGSSPPRPSRR